jgi:hypothetical protein
LLADNQKEIGMSSGGRIIAILLAMTPLLSSVSVATAQGPRWPQQTQMDLAPFAAAAENLLGAALGNQGSPDPSLQKCDMSKERMARAVGLTPQGTRHLNPAATTPDLALGLTTTVRSIELYSTATGCATLGSAEYLATVPDQQRAAFSSTGVQQPVFIRARFSTGSHNKKGLSADNTVVIRHMPSGLPDYPWVIRSWNKYAWKGTKAAYGVSHWPPLIGITLNFQSSSTKADFHSVQLTATYADTGQPVSRALMLAWQKDGREYSRTWNGELVNAFRDDKRHGVNFAGVNTTDWSFEFDCYHDGAVVDHYRVVDTYDCEAVKKSEIGQKDVFQSSILIKAAAAAEAQAVLAPAATTMDSASTSTSTSTSASASAECLKAYAAARLCQNMPADPFGVARGVCANTVKSKFGGSGCKLPF